jgi:antitoxin PrlF
MPIAQSKVTSQGQISVPAEVRKRLGIGPGSIIEWEEKDGSMVVRRKGGYTFEDMHRILFGDKPPVRPTRDDVKEGIRRYILKRHPRPNAGR